MSPIHVLFSLFLSSDVWPSIQCGWPVDLVHCTFIEIYGYEEKVSRFYGEKNGKNQINASHASRNTLVTKPKKSRLHRIEYTKKETHPKEGKSHMV